MPSGSSVRRLKPIDCTKPLHEILASVNQMTYMKQHSEALIEKLNVKLEMTYARAPVGRQKKGQTYELHRSVRSFKPAVRETELEQLIWQQWNFEAVDKTRQPFFCEVCLFIQTYQMPLQETRKDTRWGRIDLVGATLDALPVVIELKQESAKDTPLRLLVEGLAYACAVRKAWNEGRLRAEWVAAIKKNGLTQQLPKTLTKVPVILLAPSDFWKRAIGSPGKRTKGKVRDDAWPIFMELVYQCEAHGFPVRFVQFEIGTADDGVITISNISAVHLPGQ